MPQKQTPYSGDEINRVKQIAQLYPIGEHDSEEVFFARINADVIEAKKLYCVKVKNALGELFEQNLREKQKDNVIPEELLAHFQAEKETVVDEALTRYVKADGNVSNFFFIFMLEPTTQRKVKFCFSNEEGMIVFPYGVDF